MEPVPKTMKSWTIVKNGAPRDALKLVTDKPVPAPPAGADLLIRVAYAALNPADAKLMISLPSWLPFRRQPTPALDFSGTVVRAGPTAPAEFPPGTEVCGAFSVMQVAFGAGALAEYVVAPAHLVVAKPEGISLAEASGLGVVGQTAAVMLRTACLKKGDRVLINGASGGVGTILTQIVRARGASVTAVCSGGNAALVQRLGAAEVRSTAHPNAQTADVWQVVDYKTHHPLEPYLAEQYSGKQFDVIFDCVGSKELFAESNKYLKPGSPFINIVGGRSQGITGLLRKNVLPVALGGTPRNYKHLSLSPSGALQKEVVEWIKEGDLKEVPIDSEFAMEDAIQAYERVISQRSRGKVLVRVGNK